MERIRPGAEADLRDIVEIINHYVEHTAITFDVEPFTLETRRPWFDQFRPTGRHRLFVAEQSGRVAGWACSGPFRSKAAYETTAETAVYLAPKQYVGGQLIIFGGIPFVLCLGLSCPDVGDNALGDLVYTTGRHTAPLFAGDTVFAATEILGLEDHPTREDLGIVSTRLLGHKFVPEVDEPQDDDAPAGWKKVDIFSLDRKLVVKRRSHYA